MRMNLPKREELLLRTVCAFPKASRIGFALRICCERLENCRPPDFTPGDAEVATVARYWMTFLVFSVLPAPDSPLIEALAKTGNWCERHVRDENALIFPLPDQIPEGTIRHGVYVRLCVFPATPLVHLHKFASVNRQRTVRVDRDQKQARVRLARSISLALNRRSGDLHILNLLGISYGDCGPPRPHLGV